MCLSSKSREELGREGETEGERGEGESADLYGEGSQKNKNVSTSCAMMAALGARVVPDLPYLETQSPTSR